MKRSQGTDINSKLMTISMEQLEHFTAYRSKAEAIAQKILQILQSKSSLGVSRVRIGGSIGKRSSLRTSHQSDFDLVVFVNSILPPFEPVLAEFEKVLRSHYGSSNEFVFETRTRQSLQFLVKDVSSPGVTFISFDLIIAINFLSPQHDLLPLTEVARTQIQMERTLKFIMELPNPVKDSADFNSSLTESHIAFVDQQCQFVHDLIRLAKLWNRKAPLCQVGKLHGRSLIIELVAISAACEERVDARRGTGRSYSISNAFKIFLNKFIYFDRSMLVFFIFEGRSLSPTLYKKYTEQTFSNKTPMILDPVNPYNNLAADITGEMKSAFESHAKSSLKAIRNYIRFGDGPDSDFESFLAI